MTPDDAGGSRAIDPLVLAPNFKRRLSGVTSTIVQLVPLQAERLSIVTVGPGLPAHLPRLSRRQFLRLWRRPRARPVRIWHARRNIEMLAGLVLRDLLRAPLRLVFTSAAQRRHTRWTRFLIGRMDAVIATSQASAAYLERDASIVLHGIDLTHFGAETGTTAPDPYPGHRVVGCAGRIRASKGSDVFVEAMIELLPTRPDWIAVLTGRTTPEHRAFEADLRARIAAAGLSERILFLGEVDDIAAWFRRFDLYVAPSRQEGFGLTPLEAMASSTPVVASNAGAYPDIVEDGVTGRIVTAGDAKALAAAVAPLLDDAALRQRMGRAGLERARGHFALEREAAEIEAVYEAVWAKVS